MAIDDEFIRTISSSQTQAEPDPGETIGGSTAGTIGTPTGIGTPGTSGTSTAGTPPGTPGTSGTETNGTPPTQITTFGTGTEGTVRHTFTGTPGTSGTGTLGTLPPTAGTVGTPTGLGSPGTSGTETGAGDIPPGTRRKWFHATINVLDRNNSVIATMTSVDPLDPSQNANPRIRARKDDCNTSPVPVPGFLPQYAAGNFYFRASLDDLTNHNTGNVAVFTPSDYNSVISVENKFVFEYILGTASDSSDTSCSGFGPPDTHDATIYRADSESNTSISFLFSQIPLITDLGCCSISLTPDAPALPPGPVNECSRLWFLIDNGEEFPRLYSFDFNLSAPDNLVDRGYVSTSGIGTTDFVGLSWDDRDYLWGLEVQGIRQILIGSGDTQPAVAMNYATVEDNFDGAALERLFPIDPGLFGCMKYNPNNGNMYICANMFLFELEKKSEGGWTIIRFNGLGSNAVVRDMAFDPFGICYCLYNEDLATISLDNDFGTITLITSDSSFKEMSGLDFISNGSISTLYSSNAESAPNLSFYLVDKNTGQLTLQDSVNIAGMTENFSGLAGCTAGETTLLPSFPFQAGISPWLFLIEGSAAMLGNNRWDTVISGMNSFLDSNVFAGDKMYIVIYGQDPIIVSPAFEFQTTDDINAAKAWLAEQSATGSGKFCEGPFNKDFLASYFDIKNLVVIGNSGFEDCPSDTDFEDYVKSLHEDLKSAGNPDIALRAVGVFPDVAGRTYLQTIGIQGGGGYTEWV